MEDAKDFLDSRDTSVFTIDSRSERVDEPWGYEVLLSPRDASYSFKLMHIKAGCRQSLQVHDEKSETYSVATGRAAVLVENSAGEMVKIELTPETGFTTDVGQKHRLIGLTDCDVFETSTPEIGTTWRLEDDYHRPDETEEMRAEPNRGWKKKS